MFDFEKLGKKALAAPFALVIVLCCVLCLAVAPLLRADPHDISLAIVNLDEGTETPLGTVNAGEILTSQLTGEESQAAQESTEVMAKLAAMKAASAASAAGAGNATAASELAAANGTAADQASIPADNSAAAVESASASDHAASTATGSASESGTATENSTMAGNAASAEASDSSSASASSSMADALAWSTFGNEDDLHQQLDDNEIYGGIVIPADFTAQQLAAASGAGAKPQLTVYLNKGKNPQVASSLQSAMTQSLSAAGIDATIELVNDAEVGGGMMAGLIAVQMMVMPLLVMTLSSSLILSILTWSRDVWGLRRRSPWLAAAAQAALVAALSAFIAALALLIDVLAGGLDLPAGELFCWLWLGCACVMLAFVGLSDACLPAGALFAITVFAIGMGTAMLPAELMPTFWADWVFPWAPQAHLGQGVRTIVYCGQTPGMADTAPLLIFAAIGIAGLLLAAGLATAKQAKASASSAANA